MLTRHFIGFLQDERGSYTLWSLVWFIMYVAVGGLAVDGSNGYRLKTELQATADAAALAGVMSVKSVSQDPVQVAVDYALANMPQNLHGDVLKSDEVYVGEWDLDTRSFTSPGSDPNAVYVITRRAAENLNAVEMSLLRIMQGMGLNAWWNINARAIAAVGIDMCYNGGIIAGGQLTLTASAHFLNNICLHGETGFMHTNHNTYDLGVRASVGCLKGEKHCLKPNEMLALRDPDFAQAFGVGEDGSPGNYGVSMPPASSDFIDTYLNTVEALGAYAANAEEGDYVANFDSFMNSYGGVPEGVTFEGLDYLTVNGDEATPVPLVELNGTTIPSDSETANVFRNKIYKVNCGTSSPMALPQGEYHNIAIITTCPISVTSASGYTIKDTMIAVRGNYSNDGIHFSGQIDVGQPSDCSVGGLELITTGSGVHFASSNVINNVSILADGDVHASAGTEGVSGLSIQATGDVDLTQGGGFGLCPDSPENGWKKLAYALVY